MTSRGQLEEVESVNVAHINSWDISGSLLDFSGLVSVDNEGSSSDDISSVSELSSSLSDFLGKSGSQELLSDSESLQSLNEGFSLSDVEIINNEWHLIKSLDSVSSGQNKRGNS